MLGVPALQAVNIAILRASTVSSFKTTRVSLNSQAQFVCTRQAYNYSMLIDELSFGSCYLGSRISIVLVYCKRAACGNKIIHVIVIIPRSSCCCCSFFA